MTRQVTTLARAPALLALATIVLAVLAGLGPIAAMGLTSGFSAFDSYIFSVIRFTLLQAFLSTLLSISIAIPMARALVRRRFMGRSLVIRLLSLPLALPAIVAVLGIVEIFGAHGILGGVIPIYGLAGILIAHVFFNFPLAARMGLAALDSVPAESYRLGAQLGFSGRDVWRRIERPRIAAMLPGAALLIFLLCAASFTIVLTLGGGPGATTLEVAIYQALRFDFDPARATMLSLVQMALCAGLVFLTQRFSGTLPAWPSFKTRSVRYDGRSMSSKLGDGLAIGVGLAILVPPLIAVVISGLANLNLASDLARAIVTSIVLGLSAAALSFALCWPMARLAAASRTGRRFAMTAVLAGFILPPAVLATGWFILLSRFADVTGLAPLLVLAMNALMALPFSYNVLAPAVAQAAAQNGRLCASLGLQGFTRFRLIDLPLLRRPIGLALVMGAIVSLGDLTAITFFGAQDFVTLPALIYRQMGSYRMASASGTALILAAMALALVALADRWSRRDD